MFSFSENNTAYASFHIDKELCGFYPTFPRTTASRKLTPQNATNKLGSDPKNIEPCTLIMYQNKETAIKIKTDLPSMWQVY